MRLQPGLHLGISHADYYGDPCERPSLSASIAKILLEQSPAHAKAAHPRLSANATDGEEQPDEDDDETPGKSRGTLIHALLLGGGAEFVTVMKTDKKTGEVTPALDYRTASAQEHRDNIAAAGKIPVLAHKLARAQNVADAVSARVSIPDHREVTAVWESAGVLCRGRFDWIEGSDIGDLKSCVNAQAASSGASVVKYGYHISAAAYLEALETLKPEMAGRAAMTFTFFEVGRVGGMITARLDAELMELGRRQWNRAKGLWQICLESGEWPGYPTTLKTVECPPWALAQDAEQQLATFPEGGSPSVDF